MLTNRSLTYSLALTLLAWSAGLSSAAPLSDEQLGAQARALVVAKCMGCHGADAGKIKAKYDMRSRVGLLKGGTSGDAAIVPGKPEHSPFYTAVTWDDIDLQMPPKERNRLTKEQLALVHEWIKRGAPWPSGNATNQDGHWDAGAGGVLIKTSGGLSPDWTNRRYKPDDLWAYRPVVDPKVPWDALGQAIPQNASAIDAFVARRLHDAKLKAAPRADRRTLIRRATFDLTGLPPTPAEIDAFLKDDKPGAYARLINRLLASPHYGERMAQHWLDVVRYADTAGFSNDWDRPHAWRYRDYVVTAFNRDKPFDQFAMEQLAGDEMFAAGDRRPELFIAAGFLRMGPWEHTGMSVAAVTRQQFLDDVTDSVGRTFLAMGMSCFKCHDHKFDPLPTKDYYRFQAVFAPIKFAERPTPWLKRENTAGIDAYAKRMQRLISDQSHIQLKLPKGATEDDRKNGELGVKKVKRKRQQILKKRVVANKPIAFTVNSSSGEATHILRGGSLESPGDRVGAAVCSAFVGDGDMADQLVPDQTAGRRLALAKWIASADNPRTTRVIVNRVWQMHFGRGIAANANDFGVMGKKPTHPQLLDWLAARFVEDGWSIKKLHRRIMLSETYRRASIFPGASEAKQADTNNVLLSYFTPRRLTAEELRDAMLVASGELNKTLGGFPARPEINLEVAMQPRHIMGSVGPAYQPSRTPTERNRRTLYAMRIRTLPDPMLEVFNKPGPDVSCERRDASTVTPQVFALFNGQNTYDRALAMAKRIEGEAKSQDERIIQAFRLALGRTPTPTEHAAAAAHLQRMTEYHKQHKPVKVDPPRKVTRTMVEEMTGLNFSWEEQLDVYQNYVQDAKPWDVGPQTRALADLCLVLFNGNEFVYVY